MLPLGTLPRYRYKHTLTFCDFLCNVLLPAAAGPSIAITLERTIISPRLPLFYHNVENLNNIKIGIFAFNSFYLQK